METKAYANESSGPSSIHPEDYNSAVGLLSTCLRNVNIINPHRPQECFANTALCHCLRSTKTAYK